MYIEKRSNKDVFIINLRIQFFLIIGAVIVALYLFRKNSLIFFLDYLFKDQHNVIKNPDITTGHKDTIDRITLFIQGNSKNVLGVLGPWGSGKSTTISHVLNTLTNIHVEYVSFYGVETQFQATLKLLNGYVRFLLLIIVICIALLGKITIDYVLVTEDWTRHKEFFYVVIPIALSFLILSSKHKIFYGLGKFLESMFSCKMKIIVLEDLDRSPMQSAEWWSVIGALWTKDTKYIVPLGYVEKFNEEGRHCGELSAYQEQLDKLGCETLLHPSLRELKSIILKKDKDCFYPLEMGDWLDDFTPRQLEDYISKAKADYLLLKGRFKDEVYNSDLFKQTSFLKSFIKFYRIKLADNPHELKNLQFSSKTELSSGNNFASPKFRNFRIFFSGECGIRTSNYLTKLKNHFHKFEGKNPNNNWFEIKFGALVNADLSPNNYPDE